MTKTSIENTANTNDTENTVNSASAANTLNPASPQSERTDASTATPTALGREEAMHADAEHAAAAALMARLRDTLPALAEAEAALGAYDAEEDPWTADNPQSYWQMEDLESEEDREALQALETAWADTWQVVQALQALGYPPTFDESDCEPLEVFGLTFVAQFERQVRFGALELASWQVNIQGEAQQGSSGFSTYVSEDDHDLPDVFFQRLGFERTDSDFPWSYDSACRMFGLDDDEEDEEDEEGLAVDDDDEGCERGTRRGC